MKMLLISNSTNFNEPFLEYIKKDIYDFINIISNKIFYSVKIQLDNHNILIKLVIFA